ncbi:MAG: site-specific DNA-methyltransferase [Hyphomicrobiales bacterium]|nr:site-specific DNA-methyltransferase [Hyphomicrobiales bacterium]
MAAGSGGKSPSFKSRLVCGDVVEVLAGLPGSCKFDVVIADPPYNIGKDFGETNDNMPLADYLDWTHRWLGECFRLLAAGGIIYVYGFTEILARVAAHYPIEQQRWLVWHYTNKTTPSGRFWQRSHESILCLWASDGPRPNLEIDQIREPYTQAYMSNVGKSRASTASRFNGNRKGRTTIYRAHEKGALPRDVLKVPALAGGAGASERWFLCHDCGGKVFPPSSIDKHRGHELFKHPTQKPMQLTRRLIRSRINGAAGRALIPFAGSGSECVVARELGVGWLGIELNRFYVDFARAWMRKV